MKILEIKRKQETPDCIITEVTFERSPLFGSKKIETRDCVNHVYNGVVFPLTHYLSDNKCLSLDMSSVVTAFLSTKQEQMTIK